ncbi:hypothetical protein D3C87_253670 [compost metagenome]
MGNAKVIEFPKSKSVRKRLQDKAQEQKAALVVSLASVFLVAVFLNQWLVGGNSQDASAQGNRGIASFQPTKLTQDVKWEQELAKKLSSDASAKALALGEKPTVRDDLIFGYLEGKYGMKVMQGRIHSLEFIDAQAGEQPLAIADKRQFLTDYSGAFGVPYSEVSLKESSDQEQVFNLIGSDKTIVGQAHFAIDESGRVLAVTITQ